jgi:hypothetical protein
LCPNVVGPLRAQADVDAPNGEFDMGGEELPLPIDGESGPEPHPTFIDVFSAHADRHRPLAGVGEDASWPTNSPVTFGNGHPSAWAKS